MTNLTENSIAHNSDFIIGDIVTYDKTNALYEVINLIDHMVIVRHTKTRTIHKQHESMFRTASVSEIEADRKVGAL